MKCCEEQTKHEPTGVQWGGRGGGGLALDSARNKQLGKIGTSKIRIDNGARLVFVAAPYVLQ
jgi:hypothetical protein